jgi:hypothetical protein
MPCRIALVILMEGEPRLTMSWRSWWTGCVGIGGVTPYEGRREYSQTVRNLAEACEQLIASGGRDRRFRCCARRSTGPPAP